MCGIIMAINFDKNGSKAVNTDVLNMFQDQRKRGTEGFGMIIIEKDGNYRVKRSTNEIKATIDLYMEESSMVIFHHRQPTSTDNKINQTHPILVDSKNLEHKYLIVHNGVITNDDEILTEHEALGYVYATKHDDKGIEKFNDSEALAIEVARYIEKQTKEIGTIGSASFIAIQIIKETNKVNQIYFGRNTNPLKLGMSRGKIRLSSEGQGEEVKADTMYYFNIVDFKLHKEDLKIAEYKSKTTKGYQSNPHWRDTDDWEDDYPGAYGYGKSNKDVTPKNLPFSLQQTTAFDKDKAEADEIEEEIDYELAIEKETEDLTDAVSGILEQFIEDIKDEREVFMVDPRDFLGEMLKEMYKSKGRIENLTSTKLITETETTKMNDDMPPLDGNAQK